MDQPSVLITGASTGIGEACALRLDRVGWRVFAGVRREQDAEKLRSRGSRSLTPLFLDVTNPEQVRDAVESVAKEGADVGLQGLVNNAGISVGGPLEFVPLDDLRRQFEVNVFGQVAVTQAFLPLVRSARGRIVIIGSIAGRLSSPLLGPYNATKHALEALSDSLRVELQPWGISVSLIEPGNIRTPFWERGIGDAERGRAQYPPEAETLYGEQADAALALARKVAKLGISPEWVARAVERALTARRPRTRYLVGIDARVQALLASRLVPDRVRDWLFLRLFSLGRS